ncbi:hypothetical protein SAMN05421856_10967 [Chryseobacterium taichungense]|uniref:Uncharacterized protein n=1 Tax=Chryseobacterium taichungense TaxID=295069 RepID=A0A1H8CGV3_9FLAO|nr:hypothetical protein SAMN05421856_10967 [Chryseobacterium taichungense]
MFPINSPELKLGVNRSQQMIFLLRKSNICVDKRTIWKEHAVGVQSKLSHFKRAESQRDDLTKDRAILSTKIIVR